MKQHTLRHSLLWQRTIIVEIKFYSWGIPFFAIIQYLIPEGFRIPVVSTRCGWLQAAPSGSCLEEGDMRV